MKRGFTTLEILIVVGIITLFAGIILFNANEARRRGRDDTRVGDIRNIRLALEDYYAVCGNYPESLAITASTCTKTEATFGEFISTIPVDPLDGGSYLYAGLESDCSDYHVGVTLESSGNINFASDHDYDSTAATTCGGTGFDGTTDATNKILDFRKFSLQ